MKQSLLDKLHIEDIRNPEHPSIFVNNDGYKILIYRLFEEYKGLDVTSHSFVIDEDGNIYHYHKQNRQFTQLESYSKFYKWLDSLVDKAMSKVEINVDAIEELEERIYDNTGIIKKWFGLKKEMIRMERILSQAIKTHAEFMKSSQIIHDDIQLLNGFEDIYEHLTRMYRACSVNISKLDGIYNLYTTLSNEKMNRTMFSLTVISAIFLPINFIVGFFGMNTQGLFFANNPYATILVSGIMLSIFIALGVIFFVKRKNFY